MLFMFGMLTGIFITLTSAATVGFPFQLGKRPLTKADLSPLKQALDELQATTDRIKGGGSK